MRDLLNKSSGQKTWMSMSQIAQFAYPRALDDIDPDDPTAFRNATRQTSRGLSVLSKADLIDYQHAKGTSPIAWVSISKHAPLGMDPKPPYAPSGDRPGLLGTPSGVRSGDRGRHRSEKTEKASKGEARPQVPMYEPDRSVTADRELNLSEIAKARNALHRGGT